MTHKVFLAGRADYPEIVAEEKYNFLRNLLINMEVDTDECMPENLKDQTVEHRIELRNLLHNFSLIVVEEEKDHLLIYLDGQVMAEWKKPYYILKEDRLAFQRKDRTYIEIHIEYESPFEQEENAEED